MDDSEPDLQKLLGCLLEEIPRAEVFKAKWSMVRNKLTRLQTQLADISASASDPLVLDLLAAIKGTLEDGVSLVSRCRSPDILAGGKLRVQSDVDSVIARLDTHAREVEVLLESGAFLDMSPSSFSSSSSATLARGDSLRHESRKLILRFQIGSSDSRNSALDSLLDLLNEDDKSATVAVANGVMPVLVRSLDYPEVTKEKVVAAISRLAEVETGRLALLAEGLTLLNHLLRLLESGSSHAREKACVSLFVLSSSKENARTIGSRGGVSSLLEICHSGTPASQAHAAAVLQNVAVWEEVRENMIEESAVSVLVRLARSGTVLAQENSFGCLRNLVREDPTLRIPLVGEGVIECLKSFWDSNPPPQSLQVAAELVAFMAASESISEMLISDGWLGRVADILGSEFTAVRSAGAKATYELTKHGETARKEMGHLGCVGLLVGMLGGKAAEERETAVRALSALVISSGNRRELKSDERAIPLLVQLLDPADGYVDKRYPVAVLLRLVKCRKCRKEMIAAGARGHVKQLEEAEVGGVKKLVAAIGQGKILGVFTRAG